MSSPLRSHQGIPPPVPGFREGIPRRPAPRVFLMRDGQRFEARLRRAFQETPRVYAAFSGSLNLGQRHERGDRGCRSWHVAREGARNNPAPRSARGTSGLRNLRPRRRSPQDPGAMVAVCGDRLRGRKHPLRRIPLAEPGATLSDAPARADTGNRAAFVSTMFLFPGAAPALSFARNDRLVVTGTDVCPILV